MSHFDFVDFEKCSINVKIERWRQVLRVLEDMPQHDRQHHWDMSKWGVETECGTVACAAGHCSLDPWFRERGFKGRLIGKDSDLPYFGMRFDDGTDWGAHMHEGVVGFFGKTEDDNYNEEAIFANTTRRPVEQVIEEVKDRIKTLEAERT